MFRKVHYRLRLESRLGFLTLVSQSVCEIENFDLKPVVLNIKWPNWLRLQNTPIASLQRDKIPPHNECPGYDIR